MNTTSDDPTLEDQIDQAIFEFVIGREKPVPPAIRSALIKSEPSVKRLKAAIEQLIATRERVAAVNELNRVLRHSSGGGSWRRVIELRLAALTGERE